MVENSPDRCIRRPITAPVSNLAPVPAAGRLSAPFDVDALRHRPSSRAILTDVAAVDDTAALVMVRWRAGGRTQPRLRGWIHLCVVPVAVVATVFLVGVAPNPTARTAAAVYGVAVCAVFTVSALYHRVRWYAPAHSRMRRLDHGTIFVMIAGSYTPLCLLTLSGTTTGVVVLVVVWAVAAAGFVLCSSGIADRRPVDNVCYVGLGWIAVAVLPQLVGRLEGWQLLLFAVGGVLYTVGALVLRAGWPDPFPATFGYHEIWHALVVLACACQYLMVLSLVRAG
jgi:hemolysin III